MGDVDIDLYDTIEDDFTQETDQTNGNDLYDDVLAASAIKQEPPEKDAAGAIEDNTKPAVQAPPGVLAHGDSFKRRWSVYVANLTWWTNDDDLTQACHAIGVTDLFEIKFYENRANGQSRGFATVAVLSPDSMNKLMNEMKMQTIHGQNPQVHYCNRQNLMMLDSASGGTRFADEMAAQREQYPQQQGPRFPPRGPRQPPPGFMRPGGPPRPMGGLPRGPPGAPIARPGPPGGMGARPPMGVTPGPRGPPPQGIMSGMPPVSYPGQPPQQPPPGYQNGMPPVGYPGMPPMQAPAAHVNPAFFPGGPGAIMDPYRPGAPPVVVDQYGRPVEGHMVAAPPSVLPEAAVAAGNAALSEDEFQDILTRNKSVSSSAINRAVQDASTGDFASAIETLVTAISLIKQSKIASDDRCKILITSLQDTKQGIEDKSYGSSRSRRSYSQERDNRDRRQRSRSRDREYSRRGRERSRSRERDRREYRERSREREPIRDTRPPYYPDRRERYH